MITAAPAFLRFSRDKRGYEHFYLVQSTTNRRGKTRARILFWFRTPPGVKVGRMPFSDEVQRAIEAQNPGVVFDWKRLLSTPIPPPAPDVERWRERRRLEKAEKAARRALLAADEERIASAHTAPVSPLVSLLGLERSAAIDVLGERNAADYFARSDAYDMALDLTAGGRGLAALGEVITRWVRHLLAVEVDVAPLTELRNARLTWYVGLDAEGTRIGDRLWRGEPLDDAMRAQVVGLFRLGFRDPALVVAELAGESVYLILAMTPDRIMRMKPQNLLTGLPVRAREAVL